MKETSAYFHAGYSKKGLTRYAMTMIYACKTEDFKFDFLSLRYEYNKFFFSYFRFSGMKGKGDVVSYLAYNVSVNTFIKCIVPFFSDIFPSIPIFLKLS